MTDTAASSYPGGMPTNRKVTVQMTPRTDCPDGYVPDEFGGCVPDPTGPTEPPTIGTQGGAPAPTPAGPPHSGPPAP